MPFQLKLVPKVEETIADLAARDRRRHRKATKCLGLLEADPTYPGLNSHPYENVKGPLGETVWESYLENKTPSAWRVWWFYGPEQGHITVVDMGPHPT